MKNQNHKPFFSIVIPTYNRAQELRVALAAIVKQKFRDFEVIVSDNNSPDDTRDIVTSFHDHRFMYRRNKSNIGWVPNMRRAFRQTAGKYVLFHGDDDFIIKIDLLARLQKVLKKHSYGFVRLNYLSYSDELRIIFDFHNRTFHKKELPFHSHSEQIVNFIESVDPFFMTGIVIQGDVLRNNPLTQSEFAPWFLPAYKSIEKYGAILWPEYEFVATWSKNAGYPRYYLSNGKFCFESYFEEIKKRVSESYYKRFLDKRLRILIDEFPAGKYFTSNASFLRYALHILDMDSCFRFSFTYWFWLLFSLVMPRKILNIFRKKMLKDRKDETIPNLSSLYKKVVFLDKIFDENT